MATNASGFCGFPADLLPHRPPPPVSCSYREIIVAATVLRGTPPASLKKDKHHIQNRARDTFFNAYKASADFLYYIPSPTESSHSNVYHEVRFSKYMFGSGTFRKFKYNDLRETGPSILIKRSDMRLSSVFRSASHSETFDHSNLTTLAENVSLVHQARRELLDRIMAFIERHDLEVTAQNLATICGGLSGAHAELAEQLAAREITGDPIDQRWLDTVARLNPDSHARIAEVENLMDKLEYALVRLGQVARAAQSETRDSRGALGMQMDAIADLAEGPAAAMNLSQVLELTRTIMSVFERVEASMARSQRETEELRESLAKARLEADIDHLTRLPNRRAFERRLISLTMQARTKNEPLSVALCDVDHFKLINDRHGHDAGDRVLCALAETLAEQGQDSSFVARHGGEEFVLLFYGLNREEARLRVDAMRRVQASRRLVNRDTGQAFGRITFSAGVAQMEADSDTREVLARADAALYRAKQAGRNRVEVG